MNRFEQEYLKIINEWNNNLLLEANLKSLIPNIQQLFIGNKSYNDLTEQEKQKLQEIINTTLNNIETKVNEITTNKQYQSWIYNILKNKKFDYSELYNFYKNQFDLKIISNVLLDFERLSKRPDLKPQQKNIQNYSTLNDLQEFINKFKSEHKLDDIIYSNLKKVYSNQEFTVYFINKDQYKECNKLFGTTDYFSTAWCVTKNKQRFDQYINEEEYKDQYNGYFVFVKDNKPYALLHYGSSQFKDTSNETLITNNPNIIDGLFHINNHLNDYNKNDLKHYGKQIFLKEHPNATKEELIAFEIGGEYDPKTKTIDCKDNKVRFKADWLNDEGTFNFNFINATDNWSSMFDSCKKLTKLPDNFKIPNNVINCSYMFYGCALTKLPDSFTIPNNVQKCDFMFYGCALTKLPDNFSIPNSVRNCCGMFSECKNLIELLDNFSIPNSVRTCYGMFSECYNLTKLSDNFTIPNSVIDCHNMFTYCYKLKELPDNFKIPNSVEDCHNMFEMCENLTTLPDNFIIPNSVKDCSYMFYNCSNLTELPNNFTIPKNSNYKDIFENSGLEGKYNIKDLLK